MRIPLTLPVKIASVVATVALAGGAIAIGGGNPLSPGRIAGSTQRAAANVAEAERNTSRAAESTRSLVTIADNVRRQANSSRKLLEIQLRLEESSREGAARAGDLQAGIADATSELRSLKKAIARIAGASKATVDAGLAAAAAGESIGSALRTLQDRFDEVTEQSRRLNRKARGFAELKDGPG